MKTSENTGYWMHLPKKLMPIEAKRIVTKDPNLSPSTMEKLKELQPPIGKYEFHFGLNGDTDSSVVGLSMCIADNENAPIGEVVARYSELRKIPFTDTAIAILQFYNQFHGLIYYKRERDGQSHTTKILWKPETSFVAPPGKRGKKKDASKQKSAKRHGKKPKEQPENYMEVYQKWEKKELTAKQACVLVGVCDKTFLKWAHETQYNIQIENYQKLQEKKN